MTKLYLYMYQTLTKNICSTKGDGFRRDLWMKL